MVAYLIFGYLKHVSISHRYFNAQHYAARNQKKISWCVVLEKDIVPKISLFTVHISRSFFIDFATFFNVLPNLAVSLTWSSRLKTTEKWAKI